MIDDARSQRFAHHTELESYRSGHNEAVLKTVCPRGHVGSNPTLCAIVALATIFIAYQAMNEL